MVALTPRRLNALRKTIEQAGGLVNAGDLSRNWGVSRERVSQLVEVDGFPVPLGAVGGKPVWLRAPCDEWRARRLGLRDPR